MDKQNGHILYTPAPTPDKKQLIQRANDIADAVETPNVEDVVRHYVPEAYGKSGNLMLPIACSYCPHKQECWAHTNNGKGLRTFKYGHKPIHFTDIKREPKVPEMTGAGDA